MAITKVTRELLSTGIDDNSNATAITIDSSERVGINEASPDLTLHVNSGATNTVAKFESTDSIAVAQFKDNNGEAEIGCVGNDIGFYPAGSEKFRIASNGNIGVNISSPLDLLHLNDPDDDCVLNLDTAVANKNCVIKFSDPDAQGVGFLQYAHWDGTLRFHVESAERMRISSGGLIVKAGSNNSNYSVQFQDSSGNGLFRIAGDGAVISPTVQAQATSESANMVVRSSGAFERSTSSRRYKNTITDANKGLAELKTLRPVNYKGNREGDTIFYGLIAEEVHDSGLTEFVEYIKDEDGKETPDALRYPHMVALCVKAIQEQQTIIDDLKSRLKTLEDA